jgi:hypothetical protein
VEILREELEKSEGLLGTLARRKAERLAASDSAGASEAEEQHVRTLADIAGLRRELAAVTRALASSASLTSQASSTPEASVTATGKAAASPRPLSAAKTASATQWWDVYGKGRSAEPAAPISLAPAPEAAPRVAARRLE